MKKTASSLVALCISLAAFSAFADAANPLIGKWIEKFPNGAAMQTEFTATTITSIPLDTAGKATAAPIIAQIAYKSLGHQPTGDIYVIDFVMVAGKPNGAGITATLKDPDTLVLSFPGSSTHNLRRMK